MSVVIESPRNYVPACRCRSTGTQVVGRDSNIRSRVEIECQVSSSAYLGSQHNSGMRNQRMSCVYLCTCEEYVSFESKRRITRENQR